METIDLSLLSLFVAVAEAASFSRAAERTRVPKSTLSRGIARLEAGLGQQLFYRTTRQVTLTTAGAALYERTAPQMALLRQAIHMLPEQQAPLAGVLRITAPNDLGVSFLADVGARFCARYPDVRLDVELTSRHVDLVAEGFDAALRASGRLEDSSLVARKLSTADIQLFAAPGYLARRGTPRGLRDLDGHDIVQFRGFHGALRLCGPLEAVLRKLPARIVVDDFLFVREVVRAGSGIGLLPSFLARTDVVAGALVRVLPRYSAAQSVLYLIHPAARHVPGKVTAFRDFLLEVLAAHPLGPRA